MSTNWDDPTEMLARAQTARAQGDTEMAYQFYARASELGPQQVIAWQGRAETAVSADEALVSYAYAAALDKNNQALGRTLDAALDQRVQSAVKGDAPLLVALGQEFAQVGLDSRAHTLLERAVELDSSSTDALVWLAGTAAQEQARLDYLNRALATNPRDARARAGLLTVNLPAVAEDVNTAQHATFVPLDSLTTRPALAQPLNNAQPSAEETAAMERLRKLRAQVPDQSAAKNAPPPQTADLNELHAAAATNQTGMRKLMFILLAVVVVLFILGIVLVLLQ